MMRTAPLFLVCALLSRAQALAPAEPRLDALRVRAETALQSGDYAASEAAVQEGLRLKADWKEGLWLLAWTHFKAARYGSAREASVSLLRLDQTRAAPWVLLGLCEFEARDYGMALQDLQRGTALGLPASVGLTSAARYHLAVSLMLSRKFEPALELLAEAARAGERGDEVQLATGLASLRMPLDPRFAPQVLNPPELAMARQVGEALGESARRNPEQAARRFRSLMEAYPSAPRLHHAYGYHLLGAGDLEGAEAAFRAELRVDPSSALARLGLAHLALEGGRPDEAVKLAGEAVRLAPGSATGHLLLGRSLLRAQKPTDAIPELEFARDLEPSSSRVGFALLEAYREAGRSEDAEREAVQFERLKKAEDEMRARSPLH